MCLPSIWLRVRISSPVPSARGVIGSRAGFKSQCLRTCGFESHRAHSNIKEEYGYSYLCRLQASSFPGRKVREGQEGDESYSVRFSLYGMLEGKNLIQALRGGAEVARQAHILEVVGSIPTRATIAAVTQLEECLFEAEMVGGSSPSRSTNVRFTKRAPTSWPKCLWRKTAYETVCGVKPPSIFSKSRAGTTPATSLSHMRLFG